MYMTCTARVCVFDVGALGVSQLAIPSTHNNIHYNIILLYTYYRRNVLAHEARSGNEARRARGFVSRPSCIIIYTPTIYYYFLLRTTTIFSYIFYILYTSYYTVLHIMHTRRILVYMYMYR